MDGRGGAGGGGEWVGGDRLDPLLGLFGLAMSPRSASHRLNTCLDVLRDVLLLLG